MAGPSRARRLALAHGGPGTGRALRLWASAGLSYSGSQMCFYTAGPAGLSYESRQPLKGAPAGLFTAGPAGFAYESRTAPQLMAPASHSDCGPPSHGRHTVLISRTFIRWAPTGPSNGWPQPTLAGPQPRGPGPGFHAAGPCRSYIRRVLAGPFQGFPECTAE